MTARLAATAVTLVLVLAGCGATATDDGPASTSAASSSAPAPPTVPSATPVDPEILLKQMVQDMHGLPTGFHLVGSFDDGGRDGVQGSLDVQVRGANGQGTFTRNGVVAQLRGIDHRGWANAPAAFWTGFPDLDAATIGRIADRWVEIDAPLVPLGDLVDQTEIFDVLANTGGGVTLGDATTVGGVAAQQVLIGPNVFVIERTTPYLLFSLTDGSGTSTVTPLDGELQVVPPDSFVTLPA